MTMGHNIWLLSDSLRAPCLPNCINHRQEMDSFLMQVVGDAPHTLLRNADNYWSSFVLVNIIFTI